jgi:hypothetical protein
VSELISIFQINTTTVRRALLDGSEDLAILGGHAALDDEPEAATIALVLESFQAGKLLIWKQLLNMVHKDDNPC